MDRLPEVLVHEIRNMNLFAPGVPADDATLQAVMNHVVRGAEIERRALIEEDGSECMREDWSAVGRTKINVGEWHLELIASSRSLSSMLDDVEDAWLQDVDPTVVSLDVSILHESGNVFPKENVHKKTMVSKHMQRRYKPTIEDFGELIRDARRLLKDIEARKPCLCSCVALDEIENGKKVGIHGPLPHPKLFGCNYCSAGMCAAFFGDPNWEPVVEWATGEGGEA